MIKFGDLILKPSNIFKFCEAGFLLADIANVHYDRINYVREKNKAMAAPQKQPQIVKGRKIHKNVTFW